MAAKEAIKKSDAIGEVMEKNPEVAPLLMQAGMHCIGCHVSAYESIEDGCKAHGMKSKQVDELVRAANALAHSFDALPRVRFSDNAIIELSGRAEKAGKGFVRIVPVFGEYDFEATDEKRADDVVIDAAFGKKSAHVLADRKTERILRGIAIDYDKKKKDFEAKSERKLKL